MNFYVIFDKEPFFFPPCIEFGKEIPHPKSNKKIVFHFLWWQFVWTFKIRKGGEE